MRKIGRHFLTLLNFILPKVDRIIIVGFPSTESGAIAVANFISTTLRKPVFYVVSEEEPDPSVLLNSKIKLITRSSKFDYKYLLALSMSKYIFFTHGVFLNKFSRKQVVVNLWHGLLYKKVGVLLGYDPIKANFTVGTSDLSKAMFSKAFGVPIDTVTETGYPRNDYLFNGTSGESKDGKIVPSGYKRTIIWMPTFRATYKAPTGKRPDGNEVGNPFYIENFNLQKFNSILEELNAICFVKPHPLAPHYKIDGTVGNIKFMDENYLLENRLTLYEFLHNTDLLISDISSVIIDYLLMDKPILCMSADFDAYKESRGFYFDDIEAMLPSPVIKDQDDFFRQLKSIFVEDPYRKKRESLKNIFFKYQDGKSTERLCELVFS